MQDESIDQEYESQVLKLPSGKLGMKYKTNDRALAERVCDTLNQMVRNDQIVLSGRCWVAAP